MSEHDSSAAHIAADTTSRPTAEAQPESTVGWPTPRVPWSDILGQWGLFDVAARLGGHIAVFSVVLVMAFVWQRWGVPTASNQAAAVQAAVPAAANTPTPLPVRLAPFPPEGANQVTGLTRRLQMKTQLPDRGRMKVVEYEVKQGDTLSSIAERFGLKVESIFWTNVDTLNGDAHTLKPGMKLLIPPADGVVYKWEADNDLDSLAEEFGTTPQEVLNHPANDFDPVEAALGEVQIEAGTLVFIPAHNLKSIDWTRITVFRDKIARSRLSGPGACGDIGYGPIGTYTFIWPTTTAWITTYYNPSVHPAIDIAGSVGQPIFAADNGVVVYAGWSPYGYGYVVVIDHGNGWQSLYAHMSQIYVGCGQEVYQGSVIGAVGSTGNSTGPHVHFELIHESYGKVDPLQFVSPP